jgi:hypothetical protein
VCDSDSEISSDENTSCAGATNWGVNDKTPNLGHFTGNSEVKEIPSDPSNVSKVTELFFGDVSKFYVRRLICTTYEIMKNMADVISVEMGGCHCRRNDKVFCYYHSNEASQKRQSERLLVYRSIFGN